MNLPVRGQNTRNNAQTAKTLNRIDRNNFSTYASRSPTSLLGWLILPGLHNP